MKEWVEWKEGLGQYLKTFKMSSTLFLFLPCQDVNLAYGVPGLRFCGWSSSLGSD